MWLQGYRTSTVNEGCTIQNRNKVLQIIEELKQLEHLYCLSCMRDYITWYNVMNTKQSAILNPRITRKTDKITATYFQHLSLFFCFFHIIIRKKKLTVFGQYCSLGNIALALLWPSANPIRNKKCYFSFFVEKFLMLSQLRRYCQTI